MFHPSILSLSLLLAAGTAAAQVPDSASAKHQLGLTASPQLDHFFTANRSLPLGLLYKRQVRPGQALRVRLVGQYSRRDTTVAFLGYLPGTGTRKWEAAAYVGYEWQQPLGRRFGYYYGAELGTSWRQQKDRLVRDYPNEIGPHYEDASFTTTWWRLVLRPFLGLQWHFSSRLDLFSESAVQVSHQHRHDKGESRGGTQRYDDRPGYVQIIEPGPYSSYKSNTFLFTWRPVQLVGITAHF